MRLFSRTPDPVPPSLTFTLDGAGVTYDDGTVGLEATSLTIGERRVGVIGLNGSGKTTLLRLIDGSLTATQGTVGVAGGGRTLDPSRRRDARILDRWVGRVRRDELPASFRRAADVGAALDAAMKDAGVPEGVRRSRAGDLLAHFGLADVARLPVDALDSRRRHLLAAVAALSAAPAAIVADEPTKGLDEIGSLQVARALFGWDRQVVVATHDTSLLTLDDLALDRVIVLDGGRVVADGTPADAVARYDGLVRERLRASGIR